LSISLALFILIGIVDRASFVHDAKLTVVIRNIMPLFWAFYSLYLDPWLVFRMIKWENMPLKSSKEESFLSKLNISHILNLIIVPWVGVFTILSFNKKLNIESQFEILHVETDDPITYRYMAQITTEQISEFYLRLLC